MRILDFIQMKIENNNNCWFENSIEFHANLSIKLYKKILSNAFHLKRILFPKARAECTVLNCCWFQNSCSSLHVTSNDNSFFFHFDKKRKIYRNQWNEVNRNQIDHSHIDFFVCRFSLGYFFLLNFQLFSVPRLEVRSWVENDCFWNRSWKYNSERKVYVCWCWYRHNWPPNFGWGKEFNLPWTKFFFFQFA